MHCRTARSAMLVEWAAGVAFLPVHACLDKYFSLTWLYKASFGMPVK